MKIDFSGKTALITGSTSGIGLATARVLLSSGAKVIINSRNQAAVDATLSMLRGEYPGAGLVGVAADVGALSGCRTLTETVPDIDILINNAATFAMQDFFDIPDADWLRFYEVNVLSGIRLARAYAPGMCARGWGRILFISSESALNIPVDMIHYGMSKTAVLGVSRGLAKRLAGTGVTVNTVLPGPTLTEGMARLLQEDMQRTGQGLDDVAAQFVTTHRPSSILRRATTVEEVAHMVAYVASPLASATTGAALRVDGGIIESIV